MRHWSVAALIVSLLTAGSYPAAAQVRASETQQEPTTQEPSDEMPEWLSRARRVYDNVRQHGLDPSIGTIVSGSGLALGADFVLQSMGAVPVGAGAEGRISVRGYRETALRFGSLAGRKHTTEMRPADTELTSLFVDKRRNTPGIAFYVEHHRRYLPSLSLFGTDRQGTLTRADFGRWSSTTDAVFQWQRTPQFGIAARAGLMNVELFDGTSDRQVNADVAFGDAFGTRTFGSNRYFVAAAGASWDRRDLPNATTRGFRVDGLVRQFVAQSPAEPSFTRLSADARVYHPMSARHVIAARLLTSVTVGAGPRGVPYPLMESLGGGHFLRSYDSYRLRGDKLVDLTLESRWRVAPLLEIAPFVDMGRVTGAPLPGTPDGLLFSPGISVRARTRTRVLLRVDTAYGREGVRVAFALDNSF